MSEERQFNEITNESELATDIERDYYYALTIRQSSEIRHLKRQLEKERERDRDTIKHLASVIEDLQNEIMRNSNYQSASSW